MVGRVHPPQYSHYVDPVAAVSPFLLVQPTIQYIIINHQQISVQFQDNKWWYLTILIFSYHHQMLNYLQIKQTFLRWDSLPNTMNMGNRSFMYDKFTDLKTSENNRCHRTGYGHDSPSNHHSSAVRGRS